MLRRIPASALLILCIVTSAHAIRARRLFDQPIWSSVGLERFALFACIYAAFSALVIIVAPRGLLPALIAAAASFSAVAVGWRATGGVMWIAAGCWAAGWLCWRSSQARAGERAPEELTLGLALWAGAVMWTAPLRIHYAWLYWLIPAAAMAAACRRGWRPRLAGWRLDRRGAAAWATALFPLACHWLVALKPEVSADGLAMHAVIPARMAAGHQWPFDAGQFTWAVMPMGGDWVWTIGWQVGGEACARLLNVLLLALIAWMVVRAARSVLPEWPAALLAGALLATPLVQHVTGSLFVENATALWILAAAAVLAKTGLDDQAARRAFGLFCGMAVATKFSAAAFLMPLAASAVWIAGWRRGAAALPWALAAGCAPYAIAWIRTGNPVYPFLNALFRSPLYEAANFRDTRFETPLGWSTFYDLTFNTRRFIEGWDGAAGFLPFLLLPASLAAWRRDWPRPAVMLVFAAVAGSIISFRGQSNLRYLYPALPLLAWLAAEAMRAMRGQWVWSYRLGLAACGLAFALNLALMPAAGWYHRDFFVSQWRTPRSDAEYVQQTAPERKLVEWLNAHAPTSTVAWLEGNAIGDFRGRALTDSWHSDRFYRRLHQVDSPETMERLMREMHVAYFIAPRADGARPPTHVYERQFLDDCTSRTAESGELELRQWTASGQCWAGTPACAQAGTYDELSRHTRFSGAWTRDLQFKSAHRGTLAYTSDPRAEARIYFEGPAVRILYTAAFNRCRAAAWLDGKAAGGVDQRSAVTGWQRRSAWFEAKGNGRHMLQLRIVEGSPKGCFIDLDGFQVR